MSTKTCPRCLGVVLLDPIRGELVCRKCGYVLEQNVNENQYNPFRRTWEGQTRPFK